MKNGPIGPQRVSLLEGVALMEEVCQWEAGFEVLEVQAKPRVSLPLFLLPADPDVEFSATLQYYVCLHAAMFLTVMTMG